MKLHFYQCDICGKIIAVISDNGVPTECCGQVMHELVPNDTDGAAEKHVPVFETDGSHVSVKVGSVPHPMTASHLISWIGLETGNGFQFRELQAGESPEACFALLPEESVNAVYACCNIHGLFRSDREGMK